jgi:myo-inositol-1-phosphate synthase
MLKIAIVGVGNCASSLVQAISALRRGDFQHWAFAADLPTPGIERHLEVVAAFDVDATKVGKPLNQAIFVAPNCTSKYFDVLPSGVIVSPGAVLDGIDGPLADLIKPHVNCEGIESAQISCILRESAADLLLIYLPVGAQRAAECYAEAALSVGVSVINNTPACLANSDAWRARFAEAGLLLLGDDMKSHIGSTTIHQALLDILKARGIKVDATYQLNIGGNSDFLNMRSSERSDPKRITKKKALHDRIGEHSGVGIGPSDYVPHLRDNKVGYIRVEGSGYMGMPYSMEMRLQVEDSPNAAAVAIEAIRVAHALLIGEKFGDCNAACNGLFKAPSPMPQRPCRGKRQEATDCNGLSAGSKCKQQTARDSEETS